MLLREEWKAPNVGRSVVAVTVLIAIFLMEIVDLTYGIAIPIASLAGIALGLTIESRWRKANPDAVDQPPPPPGRRR